MIENVIPMNFSIKTHTTRKLKPLNDNCTIGDQIKYYRMYQDIRQIDLGKKVNVEVSVIKNIENNKLKAYNVNTINSIFDVLNIKDKVVINDDYLKFLLNNPSFIIKKTRKSYNMTQQEFADYVGITKSCIKQWEIGRVYPSRCKYEQIKKVLISY